MSDVFRLSIQGRQELDIFKERYLDSMKPYLEGSKVMSDLYSEKLSYSDSQWLEFAIRFAANNVYGSDFLIHKN